MAYAGESARTHWFALLLARHDDVAVRRDLTVGLGLAGDRSFMKIAVGGFK
jgi:hypothetical protein